MKRNKHNLSYYQLFSANPGLLIPCGLVEVLPGDTIQMATSLLVRAAPMLAPVMHPYEVRVHHFMVPHRLVWDSWEDFITGGPNGTSTPSFPVIQLGGAIGVDSLYDYFGIPLSLAVGQQFSAIPIRGYQAIFNEYYRDQDLVTAATVGTGDGVDNTTSNALQRIAWEKDYFTSSRPWEAKGPTITVPLGTSAPIKYAGLPAAGQVITVNTNTTPTALWVNNNAASAVQSTGTNPGGSLPLTADLSAATAVTVNTLRQALALQRFEEARARYGSRYTEYLRYLGVRSSDARLQRPEYLGGGRTVLQWSEVLQTAADGANPVSTIRGHGISAMRSNRFRRFIEEHGYIISLFSMRPKTIYMNSIARTWNRRAKEDFWQRELEHIGQQKILNKEVYAGQVGNGGPDGTFGYQDRYDEYRRRESTVCGNFRNSTLNFWHFGRDFTSDVALNASFVQCTPTTRPFAVPANDQFYIMARHHVMARRLVARKGTSSTF